ncbi:hypothetical protein GALMADRAFT_143241 [Galerina marginata CBS 339.88]|uniref:DUF6534 domain-containing protein n=1 Tax=Galerina marginata (strain CBS 339.88) TaxID=685588 RepID=A0A067SNB8_GALM3|nr:hypothetical protein GALMADRAFT_143241 [Galerina marginata CBS 339.88]
MASNSTLPALPDDIVSKTGPRILGYLFHWGLFGVLSTQDPPRNKVFVYLVYVLEVTQTIIITMSAFHVFAAGYGNFAFYNNVELAWFSVPVISGMVAFLAEAFYAYRISILADSYWVAGVILVLAFVQLGGSIASAVVLKDAVLFSKLLGPHFTITSGIWNGGSALCDVIIAVCMTYYLSRRGSEGMKDTQVLLKRVIRLIIETGTATAAVATLNLILASLPNHPSYYQVPSEILAKVYSNSMMVLLNSRMRIGSDAAPEMTITRLRSEPISRGTDAYELGEGVNVTITREEVVFPSSDKEDDSLSQNKHYVV